MLRRWLQARHHRHERLLRDAHDLLTFMGDGAYAEARTRAREHRAKGDGKGDRHWGRVAVEIARSTGYVIGEKTAHRYAETVPAGQRNPNRRAIISELIEISEAIRDLSLGKADATALHNAEAAVHRLVALERSSEAEVAGRELRQALIDLATAEAESEVALRDGIYPPDAEAAGKALERLRWIALPAR